MGLKFEPRFWQKVHWTSRDIGIPHLLVEAYYFTTVRGVIMNGALKQFEILVTPLHRGREYCV